MDKNMTKPTAVLLVICLVVSAALALTYGVTKDSIAAGEAQAANEARAEVIPDAAFEPVLTDGGEMWSDPSGVSPAVTELYSAKSTADGSHIGFVASVVTEGYGGEITLIIGFDANNKITGVRITKHSETAGLGANAAAPAFHGQFAGKDAAAGLSYVKNSAALSDSEVAAISGATITTDAVIEAVNAAARAIAER